MLLVILFFAFSTAVTLTAVGSPTYFPFIQAWYDGYELVNPSFSLQFEPSANGAAGINQIADGPSGNKSIDFVLTDGSSPNATQYELGFQSFPFIVTTFAAQVNFAFGQDILLTGSVLAEIYMGNITNWSDQKILATNPNVTMPNATIQVYYRTDPSPATFLWATALSAWSPEWSATYGRPLVFPMGLRNLPNFYGFPDLVSLNGAVAGTQNSIGYVQYYSVARDPALHYVRLYNKYSGKPVSARGLTVGADYISVNTRLEPALVVDPPSSDAWPIVGVVNLLVSTNPSDCLRAREFYKFIRWSITDEYSRHVTLKLGCIPLGSNMTHLVLNALNNIQCDGKSIGHYEDGASRGPIDYLFFTISNLALALALILSSLHIYHFRHSLINLIYSTVFVLGTILTLLSPIFWWVNPTESRICQARIWTMSLGFSILLGTMFSRTWQLQDIYYLQKHGMDGLKRKITTNQTYIQLAITLIGTIFTNFLILVLWTGLDPFNSTFVISNQVELEGYWTCSSTNMLPWLVLELIFFLFLLCFGVYVIYNTWSFQRKALLTETRWVLLALYNVILNIVAIVPLLAFVTITDRILSLIVIVSVDLSAGSIVCAVLLPRVLQNFQLSKTSKTHGTIGMSQGPSSKRDASIQLEKIKAKRRTSRTPDDVLAKRLEDPQPLHFKDESQLELQTRPMASSMDHSPLVQHSQIAEEPAPDEIDSPSMHPLTPNQSGHEPLQWSDNPIKREV